jgi:hypothetical protein
VLLSKCQALISLTASEPTTLGENPQYEAIDADQKDVYGSDDDSDIEEVGTEFEPPLEQSASSLQTSSIQSALFSLLYQLYTELPSVENRGGFSNPITHYLLLSSLRKNQEWARSNMITQTIAALLFTGRLVFAHKINDIVRREGCSTNQ